MKFKDPSYDHELNAASNERTVSERERWVQRSKNLLNEVNDLISADDKSLLTKNKTFAIPNFAEEAEMLEWAGISFGEENTLRLQKSIKVSKSDDRPLFKTNYLLSTEIGNYVRR